VRVNLEQRYRSRFAGQRVLVVSLTVLPLYVTDETTIEVVMDNLLPLFTLSPQFCKLAHDMYRCNFSLQDTAYEFGEPTDLSIC
jgi:hypothetical protein